MNPTQSQKLFEKANITHPARANMSSQGPKAVQQNQYECLVDEVIQEILKCKITVQNHLDAESSDIYIPLNLNKPVFVKSSFAVKWKEAVLEHANYIAKMIMAGNFNGNVYQHMDAYTRTLAVQFSKEQDKAIDDMLANEGLVLETSLAIRNSLPINSPNFLEAIKYLDKMDTLKFSTILFKKYPSVVETIRNCTSYVGNIKDTSMTTQEIEDLKEKSQIIRRKAQKLYEKVELLFNVPEDKSFYSEFTQICKEFGTKVSHLTEQEVFTLAEEPT